MPIPSAERTRRARETFDATFSDPQEKSDYYAQLAQKSHQNRLTLNREERDALSEAYALLRRIAARHGLTQPTEDQPDRAA